MVWNKLLPDGDLDIAQGDDALRANNAQLELAFDLEHQFSTGGLQTGRHKFAAMLKAAQDALGVAAADDGWVIMRTDVRTGKRCWFVYDSTIVDPDKWAPVDIGTEDVPRLGEASEFTAVQWGEYFHITLVGAVCPLDLNESAYQYTEHPGGSLLTVELDAVPAAVASGFGCSVTLELTNSAGGGTLEWDPLTFVFSAGLPPIFDPTSGAVNVYGLTVLSTGSILVTGSSGVASS